MNNSKKISEELEKKLNFNDCLANASEVTFLLFFGILLSVLLVIFFVPNEKIVLSGWPAVKALKNLPYLILVPFACYPLLIAFEYFFRDKYKELKPMKIHYKFCVFSVGVLLSVLFYWPGLFL